MDGDANAAGCRLLGMGILLAIMIRSGEATTLGRPETAAAGLSMADDDDDDCGATEVGILEGLRRRRRRRRCREMSPL